MKRSQTHHLDERSEDHKTFKSMNLIHKIEHRLRKVDQITSTIFIHDEAQMRGSKTKWPMRRAEETLHTCHHASTSTKYPQ